MRRKAIYIYLHHSHFWFLSLLFVGPDSFCYHFSSVWGTPFNILSCSVGDGFLPILMVWKSLSFLQIWKKISLGVKLKVVSFHSYKKAVAPLSSGLDCSQQEVCCCSYLFFSVHNLSFYCTFIGFQRFDYDMAWCSFLYLLGIQRDSLFCFFFPAWGVIEVFGSIDLYFSSNLEKFWLLFLQLFFSAPFPFPPHDTNYTYVDVVPIYFFPPFSSLCLILDSFYFYGFQLTNLSFWSV